MKPATHTPDSAELRGTDYLIGLAALILCSLGGYAFAWLTTPTEPPEPHYCFRADPLPCQMSVQP